MAKIDLDTVHLSNPKNSSSSGLRLEEKVEHFNSRFFSDKDDLIKDLLKTQSPESTSLYRSRDIDKFGLNEQEETLTPSQTITLYGWRNIENISARLIESYDDVIVLECLVDKESSTYEEREFRKTLFEGYDLKLGTLFYLRFFERPHEMRMEVHNDPSLHFLDDFPTMDFKGTFEKSKLFKHF